MKDTKYKQLNIPIEENLWRQVKSKAALEGKTIIVWVTEQLEKSTRGSVKTE